MKKFIYLFVASLALTAISCDKDFEEVNTSPNALDSTDPNLLMSYAISTSQDEIYSMFVGGDMGMVWGQHLSKVQYNDEEKYRPRSTASNTLWNRLYSRVIKESKTAYELAGVNGNTNLQAISLVVQANTFQFLTDVYGPIPFTQAAVDGIVKPVYDDQETVYDGIIAMLDQAETLFASGTGTFTASSDLVYGGNVTKWRKLAASLKLKVLMRISGKRAVGTDVQDLIDSGLLFSSNADSANFAYTGSQPQANPIYETVAYGLRGEYRLNSVLVDKLSGLSDSRLSVYAQLNSGGLYVGNIGGTTDPTAANFSAIGTFYLNPSLSGVILSYAQVELFLAEAINEGIIAGTLTDAKTHYVNGINASFNFNGLASNSAYTGSSSVDFSSQIEAREKIAIQMWIALYGQGSEAWTEWRRTGFPALSPVLNAAISVIPKRYLYPTDSQSYNNANYTAASATLSNGDSMLSKVWWMN